MTHVEAVAVVCVAAIALALLLIWDESRIHRRAIADADKLRRHLERRAWRDQLDKGDDL